MKAKVIYDLETRIRKERKRIATQNCRRWQMYYDTMPSGWRELRGATTAPSGYVWINNHKSVFSEEYRHALLKV